MFRLSQCSSSMLIAGIASVIVAAPPGWAAGKESFDQLVERVQGELGIGPADRANARSALEMFAQGRETFRFDGPELEARWATAPGRARRALATSPPAPSPAAP